MKQRIKKKRWLQSEIARRQRAEVIYCDAVSAYNRAEACGQIGKGYIRWRYFLKTMDFRKRDCSIWTEHLN